MDVSALTFGPTHRHTDTPHKMDYYPVIKKKENLSFETTWIKLITLSKLRQRKVSTLCSHLHVESIKSQTDRVEWWSAGAGGGGKMEMLVIGYKLQTIRVTR